METIQNYIEVNRDSWNKRLEAHLKSDFYDVDGFIGGKTSLKEIELQLLGNISGKSVLHLQCHFGQDTLSLARLGAEVTGVDLSDSAIDAAKDLAKKTNLQAEFICSNIYDLPEYLDEKFDIVFTSYGVIGWLPDLGQWASVISKYLKPGGKFIFAEFHPVVWMFDNDFKDVCYNYFKDEAIVEKETESYAGPETKIDVTFVCWNHGLGEVLQELLAKDLMLETFKEYNYSPYNCFQHTEEFAPGKYRIKHLGNKIPMVFALKAVKNG